MNRMAESYKMELDKLKELISEEEKKNMRQDLSIQKAIELVTEAAVEK